MRRCIFWLKDSDPFQPSPSLTIQYSVFFAGVGRHVKVHRNLLAWAEAWQGKAEKTSQMSDEEISWDFNSVILCVSVGSHLFLIPVLSGLNGLMVLCMTGSSATTMWGITELPPFVIQQIQPCSTLVIHSYSFLHMFSIHFDSIFILTLIHTIQYYSQWREMFLSDGSDHQNLEDESCRLKVKAPSHGRRAKNRVNDMVDAISFRFSLTPFSARTDVSTRASGLIIVPWRKGVCACVSDCLRASLVNMPINSPWIWPKSFVFYQILFVWNHGAELCYEKLSWF